MCRPSQQGRGSRSAPGTVRTGGVQSPQQTEGLGRCRSLRGHIKGRGFLVRAGQVVRYQQWGVWNLTRYRIRYLGDSHCTDVPGLLLPAGWAGETLDRRPWQGVVEKRAPWSRMDMWTRRESLLILVLIVVLFFCCIFSNSFKKKHCKAVNCGSLY